MGLYKLAAFRGVGLTAFLMIYAAVLSSQVFESGWAITGWVCIGAITGIYVSILSWNDWVDDYWYRTHSDYYTISDI